MLLSGPQEPRLAGYRFADVTLDLQRALLCVGGVETAISALPLRLLRVLCEANGALVTRQALFDAIWPRQSVSDEALTRLIGRLRELLGEHGGVLVTVRGQGLRIDSEISPLLANDEPANANRSDAEPIADATANAATPIERPLWASAHLPSPRSRRRAAAWLLAAAGALATLALLLMQREAATTGTESPDISVIRSFAIGEADAQANRPKTLGLLRLAEAAWDAGDLDRARELLRGVHADDRASPVAGLLLAQIDENADRAHWAEEASARFTAQTTPYMRLLADFVLIYAVDRASSRAQLDAVLDVRPQAYRLQLSRAHLDIARRDSSAALHRLQLIPLNGPPSTVVFQALEGRAAYGDDDAVRAALTQGALANAPIQRGLIQARLEWQRGERDAAIARLDRICADAETANAFTLASIAREAAALYAYSSERPDAAPRLATAVRKLADEKNLANLSELELLAAELALDNGDRSAAARLVLSADSHIEDSTQRIALELFNTRLGVIPERHFFVPDELSIPDLSNGEGTLVQAWNAHATNDDIAAARLLAAATASGIAQTYFAEDAQLLGALLGIDTPDCRIELPYPNYVRHSACRALARRRL